MGTTNLLHGLERKFGGLTGELIAKRAEIERIEKLAATLPALRERVSQLTALVGHTEALLQHIKPGWERDTVDPVRPHVHQIPIKLGEAGRKGLEALRKAAVPMTSRELADTILMDGGVLDASAATRQRVTDAVNQALKKRRGKVVESDGLWPQRWNIIGPGTKAVSQPETSSRVASV